MAYQEFTAEGAGKAKGKSEGAGSQASASRGAAEECSPGRETGVCGFDKTKKPRRGERTSTLAWDARRGSFAPPGLSCLLIGLLPTACAVGYILPPLTGLPLLDSFVSRPNRTIPGPVAPTISARSLIVCTEPFHMPACFPAGVFHGNLFVPKRSVGRWPQS